VRAIIDAQALLWFMAGHRNLSDNARRLLGDADHEILLGAGTIWEIAIKVGLDKLRLAQPFELFMERAIQDNSLVLLPVSIRHAAAVIALPRHHRDPFDRLLVAQAMVEQVPIISSDVALDAYPVARLW